MLTSRNRGLLGSGSIPLLLTLTVPHILRTELEARNILLICIVPLDSGVTIALADYTGDFEVVLILLVRPAGIRQSSICFHNAHMGRGIAVPFTVIRGP